MIVVKLIGGLGNQMFQYALGRYLSIKNRTSLKLDVSGFSNPGENTPRHYELNIFPINIHFASQNEIEQLTQTQISQTYGSIKNKVFPYLSAMFNRSKKLSRIYLYIMNTIVRLISIIPIIGLKLLPASYLSKSPLKIPLYKLKYITERQLNFDSDIYKVNENCYLEGFWQTEKYFKEIGEIIRKDFTFLNPLEGKNLQLSKEINEVESVSIHVRRRDYVTLNNARNLYGGICDLNYYQRAIQIIAEKVQSPHFFVFSDDIPWVKASLKIDFPRVYIDHNVGAQSYEDMRLMSFCKHNIIANSSFSWWAAWLNKNPKKIVIAPNKWFNDPTKNAVDIIPENWAKI